MTPNNIVIIAKGEDITFNVSEYSINEKTCEILFDSGKVYTYNKGNVKIYKNPVFVDASLYTIYHRDRELFDIKSIGIFKTENDEIWQIKYGNGTAANYQKSNLEIKKSCLDDKEASDCLHYLSRMADLNDLTDDDGNKILASQYRKIAKVNCTTALANYLNPKNEELEKDETVALFGDGYTPIFPFGCNSSQYVAVKNALSNNISIIEGPPGTGKTQTILNIIANLIVSGKSVQVVSNNNAAIDNIYEKMADEKYQLDFMAARLGSRANKEVFFNNQTGFYPDLTDWKYDGEEDLLERIKIISAQLDSLYEAQGKYAQLKKQLSELQTEYSHFVKYCEDIGFDISSVKTSNSIKPQAILKVLQSADTKGSLGHFQKIRAYFSGIKNLKLYKSDLTNTINALRYAYYNGEINRINKQIDTLNAYLSSNNIEDKSHALNSLSLIYLRDYICKKYYGKIRRIKYTDLVLLDKPKDFFDDYPVILSTTFSAMNNGKYEFDYIIVDESSQADISTGVLALGSAKNAVIVGDSCQLPFVLTNEKKEIATSIFGNYKLYDSYNFAVNSFLDSVKKVFPESPVTILREHYRCDPKIIGFCNDKFYDGNLIIMTKDSEEGSALSAIKTVEGDHARGRYNQRQIDVITKEVLPSLDYLPEDIGIIAPYNDQIDQLKAQVNDDRIMISTVHKFQGREKKAIIFCTVDNEIREFVDDPNLLNVAVSRAEDKFIIVSCQNSGDGNISDLISYIRYNNLEVSESKIYSVFDMLYKANTAERIKFLSRHKKVSEYDSENIMYGCLSDILSKSNILSIACHTPLNMIIRDRSQLTEKELKYALNPWTHIDFLIYNKVSKAPILAIEVDGFNFHKGDTKQYERDRLKDSVMAKCEIPLIRLSTIGNNEIELIKEKLNI
ncbi:MAG: AAA domain-containing protein [Ruminococcus sp.]|nr:AAA domain-containing protein [Ruminococcus sp.]